MTREIEWAKRVDPKLISRLYASDAKQIQDMELADEVGYGLYARAVSLIKVNRAHHESIIDCPSCGNEISSATEITGGESGFICGCGWSMTKKDYHLTYRRKQLVAITIVPFAEKFIFDWERAKNNYHDKMQAIDYSLNVEQGVRAFIEWLRSRNIEIKMPPTSTVDGLYFLSGFFKLFPYSIIIQNLSLI